MACQRMSKCHCHGVEFSTVAQIAKKTGVQDLDVLCERVGLGNTCTACRYDLADYLKEQMRPAVQPAPGFNLPTLNSLAKPQKA